MFLTIFLFLAAIMFILGIFWTIGVLFVALKWAAFIAFLVLLAKFITDELFR